MQEQKPVFVLVEYDISYDQTHDRVVEYSHDREVLEKRKEFLMSLPDLEYSVYLDLVHDRFSRYLDYKIFGEWEGGIEHIPADVFSQQNEQYKNAMADFEELMYKKYPDKTHQHLDPVGYHIVEVPPTPM